MWTIHPSYLDVRGLTALWREGLLAKKVLSGLTKGYKNHPQLNRFLNHPEPLKAINCYLYSILQEANARGYSFDGSKISEINLKDIEPICVTQGQIQYEFNHLKKKIKIRSKSWFKTIEDVNKINIHPIFKQVAGQIESWERIEH